EFEEQLRRRSQRETVRIEEKLTNMQARIEARENEIQEMVSGQEELARERQSVVDSFDNKVSQLQSKVDSRRDFIKNLRQQVIKKLEAASSTQAADITPAVQVKVLEDHKLEVTK